MSKKHPNDNRIWAWTPPVSYPPNPRIYRTIDAWIEGEGIDPEDSDALYAHRIIQGSSVVLGHAMVEWQYEMPYPWPGSEGRQFMLVKAVDFTSFLTPPDRLKQGASPNGYDMYHREKPCSLWIKSLDDWAGCTEFATPDEMMERFNQFIETPIPDLLELPGWDFY